MKILSTHQQRTMIDEISSPKKAATREIAISTKENGSVQKSNFTNINQKEANHEMKCTKKSHATSKNFLKRQK